ncbi:MAG: VacJ family lipoprotein [Verrucomicrobiaceae bacterium]|nr:VacJ family lipoprotein [Verrucomicrobiaceae bacterium]
MPLFSNCTSTPKSRNVSTVSSESKTSSKSVVGKVTSKSGAKGRTDDLDEYAAPAVSDPLEGLNRATFKLNDGMYTYIFRPISKSYEFILPKVLRRGVDNAFENVKYPVRVVNCVLQGKVKRAGQETEKFAVNTVAGVGGLFRISDKISWLADLPAEDTGLTFAKWGMGHGAYIVIPFLGPSSLRDGVGLIGDYALNPVDWGIFWHGKHDWTMIPPSANTLRALPTQLAAYDAASKDAVDSYLSVRSAYMQNRAEAAKK